MTVLALLLALVALVLFVLAALGHAHDGVRNGRSVNFTPLGLAFLTASLICQFTDLGGTRITF